MLLLQDGLSWKPPGPELLAPCLRLSSSKTRTQRRSQGSNSYKNLT